MKIAFIADSYGGARIHGNVVDVSAAQTYPELAKAELIKQGHEVIVDFASFRKITDLPDLFQKYSHFDLYIVQAGIVDFFPRPLSLYITLSQNYFAKLIRRIIRLNRAFFVKYIRNVPWSTEKEIVETIKNICTAYSSKMLWVNVAPVNGFQNEQTPGANDSVKRMNIILSTELKKYSNCSELNMHGRLMREGLPGKSNFEFYLHPVDSHLNKEGNKYYADAILSAIKKMI